VVGESVAESEIPSLCHHPLKTVPRLLLDAVLQKTGPVHYHHVHRGRRRILLDDEEALAIRSRPQRIVRKARTRNQLEQRSGRTYLDAVGSADGCAQDGSIAGYHE